MNESPSMPDELQLSACYTL